MTVSEQRQTTCRRPYFVVLVLSLMLGLLTLMACGDQVFDPNFIGAEEGAPVASENENLCAEVTCEAGQVCNAENGQCEAVPPPPPGGSDTPPPVDEACAISVLTSLANVGCWRNQEALTPAAVQLDFIPTTPVTINGSFVNLTAAPGVAPIVDSGDFTVVSCDAAAQSVVLDLSTQEQNLTVSISHPLKIRIRVNGPVPANEGPTVIEAIEFQAASFQCVNPN